MDDPLLSTTNKDGDEITPVSNLKQFKFANAITPTGAGGGMDFADGRGGARDDGRLLDDKGRPLQTPN